MLEVELDIFSGMPNPTWVLSKRQETTLYERLNVDPTQLSPLTTRGERFGLGYRGLIVRRIKSDEGAWDKAMSARRVPFPDEFRIGHKPAKKTGRRLVGKTANTQAPAWSMRCRRSSRGVTVVPAIRGPVEPTATIDPKREGSRGRRGDASIRPGTKIHETWWNCGSNYFNANADYFNDPAHVARNNCYCFASNHRADVRYALPGRRAGHPATVITCGGVIPGLRADGWQDGCQPNGLTIVMVMWPNIDYHFYRLVTGGPYWWWGHKPGGTPARYTDDCGHAIYQYQGQGYAPNNICRGNYTDFCGYFYQNNSTAFVA
jgi:hypothetical protein